MQLTYPVSIAPTYLKHVVVVMVAVHVYGCLQFADIAVWLMAHNSG